MALDIRSAEQMRNTIRKAQQRQIKKIYEEIAKEVAKMAKVYEGKTNISSVVRRHQLKIIAKEVEKMLKPAGDEMKQIIIDSMTSISKEMANCSVEWLKSVGWEVTNGFVSIQKSVVDDIITGRVYSNGWNLSKRIWGINDKVYQDVYSIVAKGIAEQKTTYEIAKDIEKYVSPNARKTWEWSKCYPGTNKVIDYNAQRLARTLSQHAYQQTFIRTTQNNPWVLKYQWEANGSRVCPLCMNRNGNIYEKRELPEDHPNGMCTWVPICESDDTIVNDIADWFSSPEGTYPEIDLFAKECEM